MSKKLNITPGEVYTTVQDPAFLNFEIRLRGDDMRLVATMGIDCSPEEEAANATLYADAHNTYNKCKMLPSELLERVKDLEKLADEHDVTSPDRTPHSFGPRGVLPVRSSVPVSGAEGRPFPSDPVHFPDATHDR